MGPHILNQKMIFEAAVKKDKDLALQAMLNDPIVNLTYEDGKKLFDEMMDNTREYLKDWH